MQMHWVVILKMLNEALLLGFYIKLSAYMHVYYLAFKVSHEIPFSHPVAYVFCDTWYRSDLCPTISGMASGTFLKTVYTGIGLLLYILFFGLKFIIKLSHIPLYTLLWSLNVELPYFMRSSSIELAWTPLFVLMPIFNRWNLTIMYQMYHVIHVRLRASQVSHLTRTRCVLISGHKALYVTSYRNRCTLAQFSKCIFIIIVRDLILGEN